MRSGGFSADLTLSDSQRDSELGAEDESKVDEAILQDADRSGTTVSFVLGWLHCRIEATHRSNSGEEAPPTFL